MEMVSAVDGLDEYFIEIAPFETRPFDHVKAWDIYNEVHQKLASNYPVKRSKNVITWIRTELTDQWALIMKLEDQWVAAHNAADWEGFKTAAWDYEREFLAAFREYEAWEEKRGETGVLL